MCVMEVRAGQRITTIAQAMAHNTSTIERDLDMFRKMLEANDEHYALQHIELAQNDLKLAYQRFLHVYGFLLEDDIKHGRTAPLGEHSGSERTAHDHEISQAVAALSEDISAGESETIVAASDHEAKLARRYETR